MVPGLACLRRGTVAGCTRFVPCLQARHQPTHLFALVHYFGPLVYSFVFYSYIAFLYTVLPSCCRIATDYLKQAGASLIMVEMRFYLITHPWGKRQDVKVGEVSSHTLASVRVAAI